MLMRKMLVAAIAQAGLGVPGVPTAADNAILVRSAMPSLISAEFIKRNLMKGTKGNFGTYTVGVHRVIEFETEFAHVGNAGDPTPLAPLYLGCGFNETLTAGVDAVYAPTSVDPTYVTLYCWLDKVLFKLEDAWGTVSAELNPKGIAVLKWRFIGKYLAVVDQNVPFATADFSAFLKPVPMGKANTPTFTVAGQAVKASTFSWDLANDIKWRELFNHAGVDTTDRQPTGRVNFELTTVAAKNWAETVRLNEEFPIQMIHGVGAGNIVQMDMPKACFTAEPSITETDGRAFISGQMSLNPDAGDDELTVTFK